MGYQNTKEYQLMVEARNGNQESMEVLLNAYMKECLRSN